jgi:hypothetical protein
MNIKEQQQTSVDIFTSPIFQFVIKLLPKGRPNAAQG